VELVEQGRRMKGRKWVKESTKDGKEGREIRKKIMKRGIECNESSGL
jgi:hypothetical protein